MKKLILILSLLAIPGMAAAPSNPALIDMESGIANPAPERLELDSYLAWATPILERDGRESVSPFAALVFDWYQNEGVSDSLPAEVAADPGKIWVNVDRPLAQTIELEESGEIEEGNTVGAEVYAEFDAPVETSLEAMKFLWGKPVGAESGRTYPLPSPFARRVEYFSPLTELGPRAFANVTLRRDGGIVKDIADRYILLVRGDKENGFTVVMQFVKPALASGTKQVFAMATLRPLPNGKTAYRISTRFQGQSYKVLGNVSVGRAQIGFNRAKVRAVAEEYGAKIQELKTTGTIKDRPTNIEWGKQ